MTKDEYNEFQNKVDIFHINMDEKLKNERMFLEEFETCKNNNDVYLFTSEDGNESLLLDFLLNDYKEWLIEKNIVKLK